jgi:LIVCS family branched-chain amino acid:cation transporter
VLLVGIASFATCISSLVAVFGGSIGWLDAALAMLPLQQYQLGWVVPAILGVAIGIADAPRR